MTAENKPRTGVIFASQPFFRPPPPKPSFHPPRRLYSPRKKVLTSPTFKIAPSRCAKHLPGLLLEERIPMTHVIAEPCIDTKDNRMRRRMPGRLHP